jgi:transposase
MLEVSERTVRNYLKDPPTPRKKPMRRSKLDPFTDTIKAIIGEKPY